MLFVYTLECGSIRLLWQVISFVTFPVWTHFTPKSWREASTWEVITFCSHSNSVVFHLFSPHPLNLFWSISCLLHTSVPSLTLPFTFTPLFLITPLSFCSLIAVMYRLPGFFSSSSSPNRIVQQGLCRSLWGEWQCRGPAVPQVENPHWKLDVKVSLLAMRLSQRKPLFVQSML